MWRVIFRSLAWAVEWKVMLHMGSARFCNRRSRFQVAVG